MSGANTKKRVCFTMQLKRARIDDYLKAHDEVWPEMLEALAETGWTNYSLFIRREDGFIVAYLETDDFERASSAMSRREINTRWQSTMAEYFEAGRSDGGIDLLEEYFHPA